MNDNYKWFLEITPSGVGSGNLYVTRCLNTFQFFSDAEMTTSNLKGRMRLIDDDDFATATLRAALNQKS